MRNRNINGTIVYHQRSPRRLIIEELAQRKHFDSARPVRLECGHECWATGSRRVACYQCGQMGHDTEAAS